MLFINHLHKQTVRFPHAKDFLSAQPNETFPINEFICRNETALQKLNVFGYKFPSLPSQGTQFFE